MNADANVILSWLEAADAAGLRAQDRHEGPGSLVAHLRASGRNDLAGEVTRAEDEHTPHDEPPKPIELAIAVALVRYVANDPAHVRFEVVDQLLSHHPSVWRSFLDEAALAIDADATVRAALEDRLAAEPALHLSDPGRVALYSRLSPADLAEHHRRSATVRDMWSRNGFARVTMRSSLEHRVMRAIDPIAWLRLVEGHTIPDAVADLVEGAHFQDMAELATMLVAAAPAFDVDGSWLRERIAIFPLLSAAGRLLLEQAGLGPTPGKGNADAFAGSLDTLITTTSTRHDWPWLGHSWLQQLVWEEDAWSRWRDNPDAQVNEALWTLMKRIASSLQPLADPIAWVNADKLDWRHDRLMAALLPIGMGPHASKGPEILALAVVGDLITKTKVPRGLNNRSTIFVQIMALTLDASPDPSVWLPVVWKDSFTARDRMRTMRGVLAAKGRDAGAIAAAAACAWMIRSAQSLEHSMAAGEMWAALCSAVTEAWLTTVGTREATWEVCAVWLAISFDALHSGADRDERRMRLASFLRPVRSPSRIYLALLAALVRNGVSVQEIDEALGAPDVKEVATRTIGDARRREPKDFHAKQDLAALAKIVAQLISPAQI